MGRNNKRMKSEMLAKIKMQYQQQQVTILLHRKSESNRWQRVLVMFLNYAPLALASSKSCRSHALSRAPTINPKFDFFTNEFNK